MGNFLGIVLLLIIIGLITNRFKKTESQLDTTEALATAVALTGTLKTLRNVLSLEGLTTEQLMEVKKAVVDIELERDKVLTRLRSAGVSEITIQQIVGVLH